MVGKRLIKCNRCALEFAGSSDYIGDSCVIGNCIGKYEDAASDAPKVDPVNHPPHYKAHPSGIECIQITEHMNFNIGNAIKYLWRADTKGKTIEDYKKAMWYITREIARLEKE